DVEVVAERRDLVRVGVDQLAELPVRLDRQLEAGVVRDRPQHVRCDRTADVDVQIRQLRRGIELHQPCDLSGVRLRNDFSSWPGWNDTVTDGGMTIGAPVCGLRPVRPFLRFLVNVPKPGYVKRGVARRVTFALTK